MISFYGDSQDDDELGVGVVDELGEGKGAKSCEDSKKLRLLSRVHLVYNINKMVVEKMTTIKQLIRLIKTTTTAKAHTRKFLCDTLCKAKIRPQSHKPQPRPL